MYQQALQEAPATALFDLYIGFLTEQLHQRLNAVAEEGESEAAAEAGDAAAVAGRLLAAHEQAASAGGRGL